MSDSIFLSATWGSIWRFGKKMSPAKLLRLKRHRRTLPVSLNVEVAELYVCLSLQARVLWWTRS